MKKHYSYFFLLSVLLLTSCSQQKSENVTNLISVPKGATQEEITELAANVVPTERQYEWQKLEFTTFLHFGMNTFTGREWGTGKENPKLFNPTNFDAKQWIKVAKDANMKLVMLTAKHHDGFCLWQTQTTEHSVKNSSWRGGGGDVLREVVNAAKAENMKVGVYLSPADLHEIEHEGGTYGNGSKQRIQQIPSNPELQAKADTIYSYLLDDYDAFFMNQLYEVLTQYGEISEVWFDGANPKPGTGQSYNIRAWYAMIRDLQPNAVIAIKGPDVRWVGNEAGKSRQNEWSVLPFNCYPSDCDWADARNEDLGSRKQLQNGKYLYWYPAETDTSIRAGWFYRNEKQHVRPVEELLDIWYRSVGNNSVLLLNISPDRRGLIPAKDSTYMAELGAIMRQSFVDNLTEKAKISTSNSERGKNIEAVKNPNLEKSWKTERGTTSATINITFDKEQEFNRLVLQEDVKNYSQRIEKVVVSVWKNKAWQEIYNGGTVGFKKIARFPMQTAKKMKIEITESRISPSLGFVGVYKAPEMLSAPIISRNKNGEVHIACKTPDPVIYYTTDSTTPTEQSQHFEKNFALPNGGQIKAIAMINNGKKQSAITEVNYDICKRNWKAKANVSADGFDAEEAIDGNINTLWHTPWNDAKMKFPFELEIDLGATITVKGFTYLPRQDGRTGGICTKYKVEGSTDGKRWKRLSTGRFDNIKNNPVQQEVFFKKHNIRYLRFTALQSVDKQNHVSVAEIGVITR